MTESASPAAAAGVPTGWKLRITADADEWSASHEGLGTSTYCGIRDESGTVIALAVAQAPGYDDLPDCRAIAERIVQCVHAASPVAPVGAPTEEHSVHLAASPIDQDFRRRPASSEAAPSADQPGPLSMSMFATRADYEAEIRAIRQREYMPGRGDAMPDWLTNAAKRAGTLVPHPDTADALRYRWLRNIDHGGAAIYEMNVGGGAKEHGILIGGHADDFIDAAMKEQK